jgi:hypothetical protein
MRDAAERQFAVLFPRETSLLCHEPSTRTASPMLLSSTFSTAVIASGRM